MKLEWILNPLVCYALLAIVMSLCLYLYMAVQRQIQTVEAHAGREQHKLEAELLRMEQELNGVKAELREMAAGMTAAAQPRPAVSGMNMNRRTQALRMARRGDRPDQIAAALQLPGSEVNLLLKVHRAVAEQGALKTLDRTVSDEGYDVAGAVRAARG